MKIFRFALVFVLTVFLLTWFGISNTEGAPSLWPKKHGELCWQVLPGGETVKLYVTNMGKGHYLVNGSVTDTDGNVQATNGNAELVGNQIIMHVTSSGSSLDEVSGFSGTVVLDSSTLDGTVEGVGFSCMKVTSLCDFSYDGLMDLVFIPCP